MVKICKQNDFCRTFMTEKSANIWICNFEKANRGVFGDSGVMVIKCENLQLHSRGLSYILLNVQTGDTYVVTLFRIPGYGTQCIRK